MNNSTGNDAQPETQTQTWMSRSIMVPAQFTNSSTGEHFQTEIDVAEYMGKTSPFAQKCNKNDPLFKAEGHLKVHVFPDITDDSKESIAFMTKHLMATCAQDGFKLFNAGYDKKQHTLVYKCNRYHVYKSTKSPHTPAAKRPKTITGRPLLEEHRCRFRFGLVFRESKWRFSTGSGILSHCYHARIEDGISSRVNCVPTEPISDPGSDDEDSDPVKAADKAVRKECGMTEAQWTTGQEHWNKPDASTSRTFDFMWDEMCKMCDDSYHATAIMQKHMIQAIQECSRARQQDPNRRHDRGSQTACRNNSNGATEAIDAFDF